MSNVTQIKSKFGLPELELLYVEVAQTPHTQLELGLPEADEIPQGQRSGGTSGSAGLFPHELIIRYRRTKMLA